MNLSHLKALMIIITGLFFCLSLSSCTKSDNSKSLIEIKTLKRGNGSDPETLDPQLARSESALTIVRDLYEGLLTVDAKGNLIPGVAETWIQNDETNCVDFTLRHDARWSNGDLVTAEDFERGWNFALEKTNAAPYSELLNPFTKNFYDAKGQATGLSIKIIDQNILAICVPFFHDELLARLSIPVFYPRHKNTSLDQPISNGAYKYARQVPQEYTHLSKNEFYRNKADVFFQEIIYITTEDSKSELKRYLSDEIDITVTIPSSDMNWLLEDKSKSVRRSPVLNSYFYGFNLDAEPFKDNIFLRRALSLAIDREVLVNNILGTGEQVAWTLVPPMIANYTKVENKDSKLSQEQRLEIAKKLYKEAGYSKQNPARFELRYNSSALHKKIAVAIASMWKQTLGVEVELYNEEWKVFIQNRRAGNTQMFRSGWIADVNDASNFLELFSLNSSLNDYRYKNIDFVTHLNLAEVRPNERKLLLSEAEKMILNDYALIPLYFYVSKHLVKPDVIGWEDNVLDVHLSQYLSREETDRSE